MLELVAASALVTSGSAGPPDLLAMSTRVETPVDWDSSFREPYVWVGSGTFAFPVRGVSRSAWYTFRGHDKEKDLHIDSDINLAEQEPEFSSVGKLFLYAQDGRWVVRRLDGRVVGSWKMESLKRPGYDDSRNYAHFSADGKSVIETLVDFERRSQDVGRDVIVSWRRQVTNLNESIKLPVQRKFDLLPNEYDLGHGSMFAAFVDSFVGNPGRALYFWKVKDPNQIRHLMLDFPTPFAPMEWTLSPDRRSLAWSCASLDPRPAARPENEFGDVSSGLPSNVFITGLSIWVSRIDGTDLREVGGVRCMPGTAEREFEGFGQIRWRPDGKALAYTYEKRLYSVGITR